jgi:hypothetical protein
MSVKLAPYIFLTLHHWLSTQCSLNEKLNSWFFFLSQDLCRSTSHHSPQASKAMSMNMPSVSEQRTWALRGGHEVMVSRRQELRPQAGVGSWIGVAHTLWVKLWCTVCPQLRACLSAPNQRSSVLKDSRDDPSEFRIQMDNEDGVRVTMSRTGNLHKTLLDIQFHFLVT